MNKRTDAFDLYIGRGSVWGNPYRLPQHHTDADRARVIEQYERYLLRSPKLMARLPELYGKRLGCFCAPRPCHGDVLKRYAEAWAQGVAVYSHVVLITGSRTWEDEPAMRRAFNDLWREWTPGQVTSPMLLFGACPDGADAMGERLWRAAGFTTMPFPADWPTHGKAAGFRRNQVMVEIATRLRDAHARVACTAFLDLCSKPGCRRRDDQQLMPKVPGHFSHGTIDCRERAIEAGLDVVDVIQPPLSQA
ncbi:DUF4326 domain-containing protein [Amycolatopsis sp. CA-230715]|uniref:DUF4326 domain-containing protein n=1 Tax=Amycolatopsis sp. CA-230715 TaxID=2745196 RepID=UPI0020B4272D|nr:DUF4326 domain-containing protein [Amycolatopsis sp. CA-230715]